MRIDNPSQLEQLHLRYAQIGGAQLVAQRAQQAVESLTTAYFEALSLLVGRTFSQGDSVDVDWQSGEVMLLNESPAPAPANGVVEEVNA